MAAYAAVVSLMNTIDNIHNHPRLSTFFDKSQIESLGEKLDFFLDFVESYNNSHGGVSKEAEIEDLERRIASAAHAAEDVIESHIVNRIHVISTEEISVSFHAEYGIRSHSRLDLFVAGSTPDHGETSSGFLLGLYKRMEAMKERVSKVKEKMQSKVDKSSQVLKVILAQSTEKSPNFLLHLQIVVDDMDSVKKTVIDQAKKARRLKYQQPKYPTPAASSRPLTTGKTTVVGFDSYLLQLLDWLTRQQSDRQIIPITGMGGIGKTTLARIVYENPVIVQHFDVRAWVTVRQEYNVREILNETLSCLEESTSKLDKRTEDELGGQLHKILFGRRYLIILDDIWSVEAWNKIRFFFPENDNTSRIVVTTRQSSVANHFGSLGLAVNLLNDDESWSLFCEKAFAQEGCPPELEEIGKKIVKKCKGLPLSIVVIGGLLEKSSRAQEYWENVARDISSFLDSGTSNRCLDILSLSYSYLPACLKPCFLHMGLFPEDREIRVSLLVKLWVAEGFLKPNKGQSLEEVAEGYIQDLVDRNLVLVCTLKLNGKTKTCYVHDLLRDLCLRIAEKEKFFCVTRSLNTPRGINRERRIIIRGITVEEHHTPGSHTLGLTSLARSLICKTPAKLSLKSRLLRVLIAVNSDSTDAAFQQINLRFVACQYENTPTDCLYKLPSSISRLWNVQTLIMIKGIPEVVAPLEIWEMRQLRHLRFDLINLPDPPPSDEQDDVVLRNLQTLETVSNFRSSEEVCQRIANLRKLRILYANDFWEQLTSLNHHRLHNVGNLNKLESLKCSFYHPSRDNLLQNLSFPSSLKKLTLENCALHWNDLTAVGSLPHFEVLKLYNVVSTGREWNPVEGEFLRLKFLGIYGCSDLIFWNADSCHFPVLEKLFLERLWKLDEIPSGIGEIPTLERICVYDCCISAAVSAVGIQKEQENLENHGLQVEVDFSMRKDLHEFETKLKLELPNP